MMSTHSQAFNEISLTVIVSHATTVLLPLGSPVLLEYARTQD